MQRDKAVQNLLAVGLDTRLAEKAVDAGYTLTKLRANKADLLVVFDRSEVRFLIRSLKRKEIPAEVVEDLVNRCDWSCCECWNLSLLQPVIIHHLQEHSTGGNDDYDNLVVLCLNHHACAHSQWRISRHPLPRKRIESRKKEFEAAIAAFKAGTRAPPGKEGDRTGSDSQSDVKVLARLFELFERPAIRRPFPQALTLIFGVVALVLIMYAVVSYTSNPRPVGELFKILEDVTQSAADRLDAFRVLRDEYGWTDFEKRNLSGLIFPSSGWEGTVFMEADLTGSSFRNANLHGVNLMRAKLINADLQDADCRECQLNGAVLTGANCQGANFDEVMLRGGTYDNANFSRARLRGARLQAASFRHTNFSNSDLSGAIFNDGNPGWMTSNLENAILDAANIQDVDLRNTVGFDTARVVEAIYNTETQFPDNFDPANKGMISANK